MEHSRSYYNSNCYLEKYCKVDTYLSILSHFLGWCSDEIIKESRNKEKNCFVLSFETKKEKQTNLSKKIILMEVYLKKILEEKEICQ